MKIKTVVAASLVTCVSASALAGTMGSAVTSNPWALVMTLGLGPAWTSNGQTQTFFLQTDVQKTYAAVKKTSGFAVGEFFAGVQHELSPVFTGQLGIALAATGNAKLQGDIWEDADPNFNNFDYNYKINHTHVALKGKLLADFGLMVQPYISGSVGGGYNRTHDFHIGQKLFEEVPAPNFADNKTSAFTYTLGFGVQKAVNNHWQVGIGYEFANWGKSQLARAQGQTLNSGLYLSHLYTNQLQLNLSYVA